MDEEIRKAIEKEEDNKDFVKGISFAITVIRDKLNELEGELVKKNVKKESV